MAELWRRLANQPLALLPAFAAAPSLADRDTSPGLAASVAVIPVMGCLVCDSEAWGYGVQTYGAIRHAFTAALQADDVAAIALLIDSPGGTVAGCFDLVDTIFAARGTKPIRAILAENAYSAAYALASATDHITVPRTGGTGSVGVLALHADMSKMLDQVGVKISIVQFGDRKADGNPFEPLTDDVRAAMQDDIDTMGELFVDTVARNRGMTAAAVRATQAATFIGAAGVTVGFADAVGAPDAAFADLLSTL